MSNSQLSTHTASHTISDGNFGITISLSINPFIKLPAHESIKIASANFHLSYPLSALVSSRFTTSKFSHSLIYEKLCSSLMNSGIPSISIIPLSFAASLSPVSSVYYFTLTTLLRTDGPVPGRDGLATKLTSIALQSVLEP